MFRVVSGVPSRHAARAVFQLCGGPADPSRVFATLGTVPVNVKIAYIKCRNYRSHAHIAIRTDLIERLPALTPVEPSPFQGLR